MPLGMGDISNVQITEAGNISTAGLLTRMLHVSFEFRGFGPFSVDLPRDGYTPEAAEHAMVAYAQELALMQEGFPGIIRIGESFTMAPIGQRRPTVNVVFSLAGKGRFETAVPKEGFTAASAIAALRKYADSLTSLTSKYGG
jgi:hypothetical protein